MTALNYLLFVNDHIVAEVVKAEFVICAVGNIGIISLLTRLGIEPLDNKADRKSQISVDIAHPFAVTLCEIIVNGNDMYTVARKRVEVCGKGSHKGFTFTRFHFGDSALMKHDTADKLNVVMALAENSPRCFSYRRERFGKDIVERFALCQSALEDFGLSLKSRFVH